MHRYSARFVVQHHGPGDCKRLFGTPVRNLTDKTSNCKGDGTTHRMLENVSSPMMKIDSVKNYLEQVH